MDWQMRNFLQLRSAVPKRRRETTRPDLTLALDASRREELEMAAAALCEWS